MRYVDENGNEWELEEKRRLPSGDTVVKVQRVGSSRAEWLGADTDWTRDQGQLVGRAFHGQLRAL